MYSTGEGLPFTETTEAVQAQAEICNKKKKSSKIVQACFCVTGNHVYTLRYIHTLLMI